MTDEAVFAARKRRVTEQLGEAVFAAVGLMVRQYLEAPDVKFDGADFDAAAQEDRAETADAGRGENESFDMARYQRLQAEASAAERGESEDRADAEEGNAAHRQRAEAADGSGETAPTAETDTGRGAENKRPHTALPQNTEPQSRKRADAGEADDRRRSLRESGEKPDGDESAAEEAVRPKHRTAEEAKAPRSVRHTTRAAVWERPAGAAEEIRTARNAGAAAFFERTERGEPLRAARGVSEEIERDARRYDGNFYLY